MYSTDHRASRAGTLLGFLLAFALWPGLPAAAADAGGEVTEEELASLRDLLKAGEYAETEARARVLLARAEAVHGADSLEVAEVIHPLLEALHRGGGGSGPEKLALAKRALDIRAARLGAGHTATLNSRNNLAIAYQSAGDYRAAARLHEETLALKVETLGAGHPGVARTMANLASSLRFTGDLARSRALYQGALEIWEETLGADDPETARTVNNLANLLEVIGDRAQARELHERVLRIRRKAYGEHHPQVGISYHHLAEIHLELEDPETAVRLERRALEIFARTVGEEHPVYAAALNTLAGAYRARGDPAAARRVYGQALALWEASAGAGSAQAATAHYNLGALFLETADYGLARSHLERAREIWEAALGPDHPWVADCSANLAKVDWGGGDSAAALGAALGAARAMREQFRDVAAGLPEREALAYERTRAIAMDVALTIAAAGPDELPAGSGRRIWDELVRSRAMVLDEMARRHRRAAGADRPQASGHGLSEVSGRLPADAALVALARYERLEKASGPEAERRRGSVTSYLAFVSAPGERAQPRVVDLGAAAAIDALVASWRAEVSSAPVDAAAVARYRRVGAALRAALWEPLEPCLGGARLVFVVADGAIHLVNVAALPVGADGYLVERGPRVHHLSAERDLVAGGGPRGEGVLIVGAPEFDSRPGTGGPAVPAEAAGTVYRGPAAACDGLGALRFRALPGSGAEAGDVASLWSARHDAPVLELTGASATERAFKQQAAGRRILHLATHGFFLRDCASLVDRRGGRAEPGPMLDPTGENPLLLAGLAMAGANRRDGGGGEDGILTAGEVAALDLRKVEWAVLSACDTGIGPVVAGEGVLGLRRAFEVAGVATTIMSLWTISDHETRIWIRHLYAARLAGRSTVDAMREASLRVIEARRAAGVTDHPFYWGAFVAAGDWR